MTTKLTFLDLTSAVLECYHMWGSLESMTGNRLTAICSTASKTKQQHQMNLAEAKPTANKRQQFFMRYVGVKSHSLGAQQTDQVPE